MNETLSVWQSDQTRALTSDTVWKENWLSGGQCTINVSNKTSNAPGDPQPEPMTGVTMEYNTFTDNPIISGCHIIAADITTFVGTFRPGNAANPAYNSVLLNELTDGTQVHTSNGG